MEIRTAYIGLGTNLGDKVRNIETAVEKLRELPDTQYTALSSLYETSPVEVEGGPFLNAVVQIQTQLSPVKLLDSLLIIESAMGRDRGEENTGLRIIDLDLLIYGKEVFEDRRLILPHPRMHVRRFVMEPLAELTPDLLISSTGTTASELATELAENNPEQKVKRLGTLQEIKANCGLRIED